MKKYWFYLCVLILSILIYLQGNCCATGYDSDFYDITRSTCGNSTLSEIRTEVRRKINDPTNSYSTNHYANADLDYYINQAQTEICIQTQCLHAYATGYLTGGTTAYYLPENLLAIERIVYMNETLLPETDVADLDRDSSGWFTVSESSPTYYYPLRGLQEIGFYPCPEYDDGMTEIWYVKVPADMDDDDDEIFNSDPKLEFFKNVLVLGAVAEVLFIENDARWTTIETKYSSLIQSMRQLLNIRPNYRPGIKIRRQ